MAHLLMYSTNYTVCRRSACLCESALEVPPPAFTLPALSVFQALAEALTTSNGMMGRRLLACADVLSYGLGRGKCEEIVNGFKAAWDKVSTAAMAVVNRTKELAVNAANKLKTIAETALAEITSGLTAIGNNIKCAASLQPRH